MNGGDGGDSGERRPCGSVSDSAPDGPTPLDSDPVRIGPDTPELTVRAVWTGVLLGFLLTPCNIYSGLKVGWSFNMAIAAGLIAVGFWHLSRRSTGTREFGIGENNINQMVASASASIVSGGLVAPIPAWTLLTGHTLPWHWLVVWVFAVSALGVGVAAVLRHRMLAGDRLPFPAGIATATSLRQIHGLGRGAAERLRLLLAGTAASAAVKLIDEIAIKLPRLAWPSTWPGADWVRTAGIAGPTPANLGFVLDPSLLMVGFGAIIGMRAGLSLLFGAAIAWGVLAPLALGRGWALPGVADPFKPWFGPLVEWLLWPGSTLMVVAALTAFAVPLVRLIARRRERHGEARHGAPERAVWAGLAAAAILACAAQIGLFEIGPWQAALAVALSFVLAAVAGWVTGETGITPIGAMGKITQLVFGAAVPGNVTANLMSANVTGGAAGQCADLLQDLKTGQLIGATPLYLFIAQMFGVLTGSVAGTFAYLIVIPDPAAMLLTPEWPAPAVATWKSVAQVLNRGLAAMPPAAVPAMAVAAILGLALALAESLLPHAMARFVPSASAIGLAFVIPAYDSISIFLGALAAAVVCRIAPAWAEDRLIVLAAGLVAGESFAGVAMAAIRVLG